MIQEVHGQGIVERPLRPGGVVRHRDARQVGQRREVAQPGVARRANHRGREIVSPRVHAIEKRRELELPNRDVESDRRQPRLDHLLERRLAAPDREQLERDPSSPDEPPRRIGVGGNGPERDMAGHVGGHRAVGDGAEPVQVPVDDLLAIERERHSAPHRDVVERRSPGVEHDAYRKDLGVVEHCECRILADERRVGGLDAGEIELARGERGELGGRLVHHDHDEAIEPRWPAKRGREPRIGGEHPAPMGLVRHEPERPVPHRVLVPRRPPQLRVRHRVEQVGRQHGQVGEHVGKRGLGATEAQDYGRIVGIVHEGECREIVEARVSGRGIARRVDGPRHVPGRSRHPVVPAHPGREPERQRLPVG